MKTETTSIFEPQNWKIILFELDILLKQLQLQVSVNTTDQRPVFEIGNISKINYVSNVICFEKKHILRG